MAGFSDVAADGAVAPGALAAGAALVLVDFDFFPVLCLGVADEASAVLAVAAAGAGVAAGAATGAVAATGAAFAAGADAAGAVDWAKAVAANAEAIRAVRSLFMREDSFSTLMGVRKRRIRAHNAPSRVRVDTRLKRVPIVEVGHSRRISPGAGISRGGRRRSSAAATRAAAAR